MRTFIIDYRKSGSEFGELSWRVDSVHALTRKLIRSPYRERLIKIWQRKGKVYHVLTAIVGTDMDSLTRAAIVAWDRWSE